MSSQTTATHPRPDFDERRFRSRPGPAPSQPNIVFILADDLGWADLSCYGSPHIHTPNLDRLAAGGVRFTHAYAASPWCSPTRIALYTGRNPGRLAAGLEEPLRTRVEGNGIPAGHPTLPSLLGDAEYDTAMFGKWHCGWLPWFSPLRIGFATFFGNLDGAIDYHTHIDTLGRPDLYEGETPVEATGYYTALISDRVVDYLSVDRDRPFYVQVNYTAPHWPWEGPGDADVGAEIRDAYTTGRTFLPLLHRDGGSLAKYAELVEAMDKGIGQILDALAVAGCSDDTIVVFSSDNGGERWSMNWPFIGEKGDLTEGGIRVPHIVRWPQAMPAGQVSDHPNTTTDWTATLLAAAGTGPHPDYPLDGVSLHDWLTGGAEYPAHDLFWRTSNQGALRRGNFKYLWDGRDRALLGNWPRQLGDHHFLYHLYADGREAANLADRHPDLVADLRGEWEHIDRQLLTYPPDHPGLPRPATTGRPAISAAD